MQLVDGKLIVSATDLVGFMQCEHLTWLERLAARGDLERPTSDHPMLQLLQEQGNAHEQEYLERLRAAGLDVLDQGPIGPPASGAYAPEDDPLERITRRAAATRKAMESGVQVIYQAGLLDDSTDPMVRGYADFLRRVETPSDLGHWSYEPEDTKLSSHVSAWAVLQLCVYAAEIARIQGQAPEHVHVVLGSQETASIRLADISAYFRSARERFLDAVEPDTTTELPEPYPLPVAHCSRCSWHARCEQRWRDDDHLSQVAFMRMDQMRKFEAAGITTMAELAAQSEDLSVPGVGDTTVARLREQASVQVESAQKGGPPAWRAVTPVEHGLGLAMLPAPSPGDIFYDIEGHPYAEPNGLEYLHGYATINTGTFAFTPIWAHSAAAEKQATEALIDLFIDRVTRWPDMHIYHYASYEVTALKKMVMHHGTREDELDRLLRAEVFVDLYKVVRQGMRIGVSSYSIKRLEPLYMAPREGEIGNGGSSILEYERYRNTGDSQILDEIEAYNKDDVESTMLLREWLEERRNEIVAGGMDVPRPEVIPLGAEDSGDPRTAELIDRLLDGIEPAEVERVRGTTWTH